MCVCVCVCVWSSGVGPPPGFTGPAGPAGRGSTGGGGGRGATGGRGGGGDGEREADYSDATFDEFSGFSEQLFASGSYDTEDREADDVYSAIDQRMDSRRKERREALEQKELEDYRARRPKIAEIFQPLKRNLATVSETDWLSIPEPLDYSRQNKMRKRMQEKMREKMTAVPDSVLMSAAAPMEHTNVSMDTPLGVATPAAGLRDLTQIGEAQSRVLQVKLDRLADNVHGQTVVDPKGYLTDMNSVKVSSAAEVSDIKKARLLVNSLVTTNPYNGPAWIASARLEAETGKISNARVIIKEATHKCPKSEDVWLEAARLHAPEAARRILADAVKHCPRSIKIWLAARDLETEEELQKAVLRKALDLLPNSETLWKAAVEKEKPEDARIMLARAVECVPTSVDMWLALARLETYENAKKVLNQARAAIPSEPAIWISAAVLEETKGNHDNIDLIVQGALRSMAANGVHIERDAWLAEAEKAEKAGMKRTCQALVRQCLGLGVEEIDQRNTWLNDAQTFLQRGSVETARATYAHLLAGYPGKKTIWLSAAQLEKQHGNSESLDALLERACSYCPRAEDLWLMRAKEKWLAGQVAAARSILDSAFNANPESEDVWLAAVKLESENEEFGRARLLLSKARDKSGTAHVWMKSALLERQMGDESAQDKLLSEALLKFPTYPKLWMMKGQFHLLRAEALKSKASASASTTASASATAVPTAVSATVQEQVEIEVDRAREAYRQGLKLVPSAVDLWLCYVELEVSYGAVPKARSILETARLKNPKNDKLWLSAIRVEQRAQNEKVAEQLLAKALQECPNSGLLYAHAIASDKPPARKARSYDALKRTKDDAMVFTAVAKLFWLERKVKKARDWFVRAITVDPDYGDAWVFFYKFEVQYGTPEAREQLLTRCREAAPRHGEVWVKFSKNPLNRQTLKPDEIVKAAQSYAREQFTVYYDQ